MVYYWNEDVQETDFEYLAVIGILVEYALELSDECWKNETFVEVIYDTAHTSTAIVRCTALYSKQQNTVILAAAWRSG